MAFPWRCVGAVAAVLVALVVVDFASNQTPGSDPGCAWGEDVAIVSISSEGVIALEAVDDEVRLVPPQQREGLLWKINHEGGTLRLRSVSGRHLQDIKGKVSLGIPSTNQNHDRWWATLLGDKLKLQSSRQMFLMHADGQVQMTEDEKQQDGVLWSVVRPDGNPAFHPSCWQVVRKKRDATLNDGWVAPHKQTPDHPPQPSILANYSWKPFYKVKEEDIKFYDEHGFVLLKQVVEPEIMDLLYKEAELFCKGQIAERNVCQIEMLRWQLNTFRDFLLHGPLGSVVHSFIRGNGVRVSTEALFGTVYNEKDPPFFSYQYHTDAGGQFGVFHGFASGTPAAAAWFPLHDVDAEVTGGGIKVIDGFPHSECKWRNCNGMLIARGPKAPKSYNCPGDCATRFAMRDCGSNGCKNCANQQILSFKKGDIVVWHSDMPHATQSTKQVGFSRYAFTVRFVDSDAVMCDVAGSCGGWMACCRDTPLVSGNKIHSHCYPQVHPGVLEHEVQAHYSSTPKFLIADPDTVRKIGKVPPSSDCFKPDNARTHYE